MYIWPYGIALAVFLALDAAWLSTAGRTFYVTELGGLLRESPNFIIALLFYLLFVAGLCHFVIVPAHTRADPLMQAAMAGAFFGLVAYATYDLTNLSTIKNFSAKVAIVDMVWGAVLSGFVTTATLYVLRLRG
jgi:uncharacterized membrane protein